MSIESEADLQGLQRAGRVVALALAETRRAVEPGVTTAELVHGGPGPRRLADGWTVWTRDGSLTAHAERTVVVTRRGSPLVLTSGA